MQETATVIPIPERTPFPSTNICMNYESRERLANALEASIGTLRYGHLEEAAKAIRAIRAALAGWGA